MITTGGTTYDWRKRGNMIGQLDWKLGMKSESLARQHLQRNSPLKSFKPLKVESHRRCVWKMDTMRDLLYGWIGLLAIVCLVGYYFLSRALARTNQVLVVWQKIAEMPVLGNHVGSIFTMLMKIRNPYSRSIRTSPPTSPFLPF